LSSFNLDPDVRNISAISKKVKRLERLTIKACGRKNHMREEGAE
jgi:hypothetical protein